MNLSHSSYPSLFRVKYQLEQKRELFRHEAVLRLPKGRFGLYAFWLLTGSGEEGDVAYEPLYVGESTTCIRRRLLQHLSHEENPGLRSELRLFGEFCYFSTAFTEAREETLALETALIREWQPATNRNKRRQ